MNEWVWRISGMILTAEIDVLGEKHYTAWVVDGWMGMEHWWNDIDRGNHKHLGKSCLRSTVSITNLIWTDLRSNPGPRCKKPQTNSPLK